MFNSASFVERDIIHLEHVVPYALTVRGVSIGYWRMRLDVLLAQPLGTAHRERALQLVELLASLEQRPKCRTRARHRV